MKTVIVISELCPVYLRVGSWQNCRGPHCVWQLHADVSAVSSFRKLYSTTIMTATILSCPLQKDFNSVWMSRQNWIVIWKLMYRFHQVSWNAEIATFKLKLKKTWFSCIGLNSVSICNLEVFISVFDCSKLCGWPRNLLLKVRVLLRTWTVSMKIKF